MIRESFQGQTTVNESGSEVAHVELSRCSVGQELSIEQFIGAVGLEALGIGSHCIAILFAFEIEIAILFVVLGQLFWRVFIRRVLKILDALQKRLT